MEVSGSFAHPTRSRCWIEKTLIMEAKHRGRQCTKSVYPFHDGQFEDFDPIFQHLIAASLPPLSPDFT